MFAHNTQKRTKAKAEFVKNLYKLINNAFFGKTMENVRERTNLEIIPHTEIDQILKRQYSKLSFKVLWIIILSLVCIDTTRKNNV